MTEPKIVGRWGETVVSKMLHIVDRQEEKILCTGTHFFLPGFCVGQRYDMTPYCGMCRGLLINNTMKT